MIRGASLRAAVMIVALTTPGWARAEDVGEERHAHAKRFHDDAVAAYDSGDHEAALRGFEKAYELEADPVLLYNQAQAHRKLGRREAAVRLYRLFLEAAPEADRRAQVEARIAELSVEPTAPVATATPPTIATTTQLRTARSPEGMGAHDASGWQLRAAGAGGYPSFTLRAPQAQPWERSALAGAELGATRAIELRDGMAVELGVSATFTAVPYWHQTPEAPSRLSSLWGAYGDVGLRRAVGARWAVIAAAGVGVELWTGLGAGNPFTRNGGSVGAMALPSLRGRVAIEVQVARKWRVFASPGYVVSIAPSATTAVVSNVQRFQLALGVSHAL